MITWVKRKNEQNEVTRDLIDIKLIDLDTKDVSDLPAFAEKYSK